MQALNALPAVVGAPALVEDVPLGVVGAFVPQAAKAMAATETTATIFIDERKALSFVKCTRFVKCT